ncbi:MAG: response regulator transcription factor [Sphingobium sp.]|nr:response regulator transcription factor [Sphingobium sp.]
MTDNVLIVDDEPAIAKSLQPALTAQGYETQIARTAAEALRMARMAAFDLVLLDLGLPDADGKDIIGQLHSLNCRSVIVLSARHLESEKVAALDRGADDYLDKPFGIDELMARIRVAMRRKGNGLASPATLAVKDFRIDFASRRVTLGGREVRLSPKEYALLECLCRHAGQIVTRRQLLIAGWNNPVADEQNLRVYMTLLRQKLEEDKSDPRLIVTETGVGYRFVAED